MKTLNLYFDMEFTSLSPDSQIISLGIVSEEPELAKNLEDMISGKSFTDAFKHLNIDSDIVLDYKEWKKTHDENKESIRSENETNIKNEVNADDINKKILSLISPKSFYAEFSDFNINYCDDWVKENVVKKLNLSGSDDEYNPYSSKVKVKGDTNIIKQTLSHWLHQFKDYQLQFIYDCGTFDWYHLLQLIGDWEYYKAPPEDLGDGVTRYQKLPLGREKGYMVGLPKLPSNISPVPFDLNDLIAIKKGITPKEAFDMDRMDFFNINEWKTFDGSILRPIKHNALFDAKIIKLAYEILTK